MDNPLKIDDLGPGYPNFGKTQNWYLKMKPLVNQHHINMANEATGKSTCSINCFTIKLGVDPRFPELHEN